MLSWSLQRAYRPTNLVNWFVEHQAKLAEQTEHHRRISDRLAEPIGTGDPYLGTPVASSSVLANDAPSTLHPEDSVDIGVSLNDDSVK